MKNIHVLPTDKPSRLFENTDGGLSIDDELQPNGVMCQNQNIYITSDEKIKEGDWYIADDKLYRASVDHMPELYTYPCKKIILTTGQDLIKDGVQAVDDDFLEWFVKNPSCEEVEIKQVFADGGTFGYTENLIYKIILPKEEAKPFKDMLLLTKVQWEKFKKNPIPSKKETLEEAAEKLTNDFPALEVRFNMSNEEIYAWFLEALQKGAKWQQERMYSEEDLIDAFNEGQALNIRGELIQGRDWFEKFKNK